MMRVLLFQLVVPTYRKAVFTALSKREDVQVSIASGSWSPDPLKLEDESFFQALGIHHLRNRFVRLPGLQRLSWQSGALALAHKMRPDVIIVQGGPYELTSWALLLWAKVTGTPVLAWTLGLQKLERGLKWALRSFFLNRASGLLLYGDYPAAILEQGGFPRARMHIIYNSLDLTAQREAMDRLSSDAVDQLRSKLAIKSEAPCFVFIGRIVARKRLAVAIRAIAILISRGIDAHFILIGDGDDRERLEQLAIHLGAERHVHFVGALYEESEIATYMALAMAAIIPEAGLPIIHPMAYGVVPVISDNVERHGTEWEAVIQDETGLFFRDDVPESLADRLVQIVAAPVASARMGSRARQLAFERYSAESHAERIIEGARRFFRGA